MAVPHAAGSGQNRSPQTLVANHFAIDAVIATEARITAPIPKQIPSTRNKPNNGDIVTIVTIVRATTSTLGIAHMKPSQTQNTVTSTNIVRREKRGRSMDHPCRISQFANIASPENNTPVPTQSIIVWPVSTKNRATIATMPTIAATAKTAIKSNLTGRRAMRAIVPERKENVRIQSTLSKTTAAATISNIAAKAIAKPTRSLRFVSARFPVL
jgi:hypothetical protein